MTTITHRVAVGVWLSTSPLVLADAGDLIWRWDGYQSPDMLGKAVAGTGDINGDGVDDVLIGVPSHPNQDNEQGEARLYSGKTGLLIRYWLGQGVDDTFGSAVAGAGDVNGDRVPDVIIGAKEHNGPGGPNSGAAYVYSGATGSLIWKWTGESGQGVGDQFGYRVAGVGDVNGDECPDIAVSAAVYGPQDTGKIYVFSGATGQKLWEVKGDDAFGYLGFSLAAAGYADDDRHADVVAGAFRGFEARGTVIVFSGKDGQPIWRNVGDQIDAELGAAVAGVGDLNGDGHDDILAGAADYDGPLGEEIDQNCGKAYVFSGKDGRELWSRLGEGYFESFGNAVSASDVDGDRTLDLIIAAPNWPDEASYGKVYVFSGKEFGLLNAWTGDIFLSLFGEAVAGAGDLNSDGYEDVLIGETYDHGSPTDGTAYAFAGGPSFRMKTTPFVPGKKAAIKAGGSVLQPGETVQFLYSTAGQDPYDDPALGHMLLEPPVERFGWAKVQNPGGSAVLEFLVPASFIPGQSVYLQSVVSRHDEVIRSEALVVRVQSP